MTETRPLLEDLAKTGTDQNLIANSAAGHLALVPTWLPLDVASAPNYNSAGSGGDGISEGVIDSNALAVFVPSNAAIAGPHSSADAFQGNDALVNQHPTEVAGIGGNGGSGNIAIGGGVSHAGTGGNGLFFGGLVSTDVAVFAPVNAAVAAGHGAAAHADQSNNAVFLQGATQMGGIGGSGGDHNIAIHDSTMNPGTAVTFTGDNYAGHGGNGVFVGSMVDVNVAIFSPINIAVGAAGGSAEAHQTNNAIFDQGTMQIAGIGGNGGGFNMSSGTIFTGNHEAGGGGIGSSTGSMVDVNLAYFHPINIAVPAGGTADAQQIDHVLYDQHALQLAGVGGHGGGGNLTDAHSALVDDILGFVHT
ncbi:MULTISPECIES: hypothetical protein [unclassified Rhizobium]|uniref:hypothetical protein n=1 Tax=unclassified Rhizobium TaxID=2613769 RepID=UPI00084CB606|nr:MULTISPECIES: hypothetical protein [unclassified Rhizobium]OEC96064.1 hypothetical protein A9Z06_00935 [Rhizobium sp. YK2]QYA16273.1 hypothetical protein J5284_30365 [Rhizobium sp. AB2/73]UEQ84816.1 hypothetical protein I8E17_26665 [Rhizobium sp. AB2/73]